MRSLRHALFPLLFLSLTVGLLACGQKEKESASDRAAVPDHPVYGGILRVASSGEPDVLNSLITTSGYSGRILGIVGEGLIALNRRLEWEPALAESWQWLDDGLTLRFHLRKGLRWSDGAPFSAYDVQRSYELFTDPVIASTRRSNFVDMVSCSMIDSLTVEMKFSRRSRDQLFNANLPLLPAHIVDDLDPAQVESWPINRKPVGMGPFRLKRWDSGERIVLERNPYYWVGKPYLDGIVFEFTPEQTVRLLKLESGEVDMVTSIAPKDEARLRKKAPDIKIYALSGRRFAYLCYNLRRPFLDDVRVRQAFSHAIDRRAFTENLMFGRAQPAASIIVPALGWAYDASLPVDAYDPELSRKLLAEAGFSDEDQDGVIEKDGRAFEVEILTRTGDPVRENGILILQQNLARVGIKVKLKMMELSSALAEVRKGEFDIYYGHYSSRMSVDPTNIACTGGAMNWGGYSNPQIDRLVRQGLAEMDMEKAKQIWYEFQRIFAREQPWTMLYYYDSLVGIRDTFHDCTPDNLSPFYDIHRWWTSAPEVGHVD